VSREARAHVEKKRRFAEGVVTQIHSPRLVLVMVSAENDLRPLALAGGEFAIVLTATLSPTPRHGVAQFYCAG